MLGAKSLSHLRHGVTVEALGAETVTELFLANLSHALFYHGPSSVLRKSAEFYVQHRELAVSRRTPSDRTF